MTVLEKGLFLNKFFNTSLLILLCLISTFARSEQALMVSDQTDRINLLPYLEYLPDSAHTLSFEEIRQTADSAWRQAPRDRENLNFGYTDDVY